MILVQRLNGKEQKDKKLPGPYRHVLLQMCVIHMHHGIYAAIKKNKIMSFAETWMELEAIIPSKLMQEQKTKYCMFSLIRGS